MNAPRAVLAASPLAWAMEAVRLPVGDSLVPFVPYRYQAGLLADRSPRVVVLKARQVGVSQGAAILAGHEATFRSKVTVLVVSRDQGAAGRFLSMVYDVLDALDDPPTFTKRGSYECEFANGSRIISQPATGKAGRGVTATLVVLDEFAFAEYADRILRAVLPTLSRGGRLIVISTPDGGGNLFAELWSGRKGGEWSRHRIHWSDCPAFAGDWYARSRADYQGTAADWASEYECDFVESGGAAFDGDDVEAMRNGWLGLQCPNANRRYVTGWDIGRRRDATVGITLDVTALPWQVVAYERLLRAPFAQIQALIDRRAKDYGGETWVEANGIGDPVIEALTCRAKPFTTTAQTKAAALTKLVRAVENGELKAGTPQLLTELGGYQWDDARLVQDSVMALAISVAGATAPTRDWRAA